jgi:glycosyltransferase involved in cell wall biosynthesis
MKLVLITLAITSFIELLLLLKVVWHDRKPFSWLIIGALVAQSIFLIVAAPSLLSALIIVITLYRLINIIRILKDRLHDLNMRRVVIRSSLYLISFQFMVLGVGQVSRSFSTLQLLYIIGALVTTLSCLLLGTFLSSLKKMRYPATRQSIAHRDLPSLTVAIPARNETDDLQLCLDSLVLSSYPKLEIIVLDDCSQDKRTPEIIRKYAHDGVRFLSGTAPPENWLAKNYAYQQLAAEANGELILFCGVDVRYEPDTIKNLVETFISQNLKMMSLMPLNLVGPQRIRQLIIQPLRYAWEVAVPRRWQTRPPLLSTCWLINRKTLEDGGSFKAYRSTILPERMFARSLHGLEQYAFYTNNQTVGLTTIKSADEQYDTAIRMRYPQLHRRPEYTLLLTLLELTFLVAPPAFIIYGQTHGNFSLTVLGLVSLFILITLYVGIVDLTYKYHTLFSILLAPAALMYDVILLNISMSKYEFNDVFWKGRNICLPALQAIPSLPRLR